MCSSAAQQKTSSRPSHCSNFKMSVLFRSSESDVHIEVGEYQEFPKPEYAAVESPPKPSK